MSIFKKTKGGNSIGSHSIIISGEPKTQLKKHSFIENLFLIKDTDMLIYEIKKNHSFYD